jgi:hypothetical protein
VFGQHWTKYSGIHLGWFSNYDPEEACDCEGHNYAGAQSTNGHAAAVATTAKWHRIALIVIVPPTPTRPRWTYIVGTGKCTWFVATSGSEKHNRVALVCVNDQAHQQKLNILHEIYLVYCTHKLKKMKSRFPWNMTLLYCPRVYFEPLGCSFQASWPRYPRLRMWQRALDERLTLPLAMSQIISRHTPSSLNSTSPRHDDSTRSIRLMNRVVLIFKDPHGLIWPMIVPCRSGSQYLICWYAILSSLQVITRGLCIVAIMIWRIWDQTSVNHQPYYIYYYYDIYTKARIK